MDYFRKMLPALILPLLLVASGGVPVCAQEDEENQGKMQMSRAMLQAVQLYREKRYNDAMDKFLDIMVTGTPSEKAIANDYINRINQRFSADEEPGADNSLPAADMPQYPGTPQRSRSDYYRPESTKPSPRDQYENPVDDRKYGQDVTVSEERRDIMARRIERKIEEMRKLALIRLNKVRGIQIFMVGDQPEAVSIDPELIFNKDVNFKPNVETVLDDLTTVMFTLGKASFLILPEGIYAGDTQILQMRRAMAVNSYFARKGISTARLQANLNITSQELPKKFKNIPGIGILFYYDKPFTTSMANQIETDAPPALTLGASPDAFSPARNDGSIIEFAVIETAAKISFWKFQLLYYDTNKKLHVIQDATGEEPTYHQVFWNGREDFFGEPYPAGRYLAVVAASDVLGRERIVRKPILLYDKDGGLPSAAGETDKTALGKKMFQKDTQAKTADPDMEATEEVTGSGEKRDPDRAKPERRRPAGYKGEKASETSDSAEEPETADESTPTAKSAPGDETEPADSAAEPSDAQVMGKSNQVTYNVAFRLGTAEISSNGGAAVRQVADNISNYPLSKVILTGVASDKETDPEALAQSRAEKVSSMLTSKYGVDSANVSIKTRVSSGGKPVVEVRMVTGN
ncbi:MAG: hypothetical protein WCS77_09725 [Elusimicrobiaceae bacterium]